MNKEDILRLAILAIEYGYTQCQLNTSLEDAIAKYKEDWENDTIDL